MHVAKICRLKVYNSVAFSSGTMFATITFSWSWNIFITSKDTLNLFKQSLPSPPAGPLAAINLLSSSVGLLILDISYPWNHTIRGLMGLASFPQHHVFKVHHLCHGIDFTSWLKNISWYGGICL